MPKSCGTSVALKSGPEAVPWTIPAFSLLHRGLVVVSLGRPGGLFADQGGPVWTVRQGRLQSGG